MRVSFYSGLVAAAAFAFDTTHALQITEVDQELAVAQTDVNSNVATDASTDISADIDSIAEAGARSGASTEFFGSVMKLFRPKP